LNLFSKRTILLIAFTLLPASLFGQHPAPDGTPRPLTPKGRYFMQPVWSPDGTKIAFAESNYRGIWVKWLDSGKLEQIVNKPGAGYRFAWSPDSRYIAFRARYEEHRRARHAIEVVDVASKEVRRFTPLQKRVGLPIWGTSNATLFYTQNQKLRKISTGLQTRRDRLFRPPHGGREIVVFTSYQQLRVAERFDSLLVRPLLPEQKVLNPVLSPDGIHLAFEEYGGDLIVLNIDSGRRISLGEGYRPSWSPDGKWLCYMITRDDGHQFLASDIYAASADGGQKVRLTDTEDLLEMNPSWSPDGRSIAFDEHKSGQIFLLKIKTVRNEEQ